MEEKNKKKIDLMIDFNKLEGILDELLVEFEKSKEGDSPNASVGFSITIDNNGNIDISKPEKKTAAPGAPGPQSKGRFAVKPGAEKKAPRISAQDPLVETFGSGAEKTLVLHLPGITHERQVRVVHQNGVVSVSAKNRDVQYFKAIPAPAMPAAQSFNNGVLELSFGK